MDMSDGIPPAPTFSALATLETMQSSEASPVSHGYGFEDTHRLSTLHSFLLLPKCFLRAFLIYTI